MSKSKRKTGGCKKVIDGKTVKARIKMGDVHLKSHCGNKNYYCDGCKYNPDRR